MKENEILKNTEQDQQDEVVEVRHRHVHWDILAVLLCLVLAFAIWLCVMNTKDTDYVPFRLVVEGEGTDYTYALSTEGTVVEGTVSSLKELFEIDVIVPEGLAPGKYELSEADLDLPEGVYPVGELHLTLTVSE